MMPCFAIVPDGQEAPVALFAELEDAMEWGLRIYGGDAFRIRYLLVTRVEDDDRGRIPLSA
jgi:hypothetical protein